MVTDLPDYEKKVVVVTIPGNYPAEMQVDHRKILGAALKSPTFPYCIPSSIENTALAYNSVSDRFKVDIEALTVGVIPVSLSTLLNPHPVTQTDAALLKATVSQATRTSLKVQTEREDLLCKSFDLTVGTTSLLAAVANQYHKIYGWDYEADTDGANEFSATISSVACKFARRVTKGVHAMTLVHPIVCDVNTALSFISAGNTKLSLRYKTEA